ncbi:UPF0158 family protein [Pseudonocardia sp. WMMC193]|uniref:UPF0158 family protein n=1 Tax=Pseudonocardia sp. WMMC193 TaxID=2911965 RepID=UPI001F2C23B7|nr:UPF0158 family protein [Pseudonocardia sp. WMMC193]MCF7551960.1 UPF0158 family protein [Pseudonocardia sp. WMMC193]
MLDPARVDLAELVTALDDRTPEVEWFIDPATGRIVPVIPEAVCGEPEPDVEGWVAIAPTSARDGYQDMADFTAGVQHRRAAELLDRALNGRGAFRRFKNTLFDFPEVRDQWFRFRDARARRRALDWLVGAGLVTGEDAALAATAYPDPEPENEDLPAVVAVELAAAYGDRLSQVLLVGPWASGEGSVESPLELLVVLGELDSPWTELRRIDEVLWRHTERSGITVCAYPVSQAALSRPVEPWLVRARAEAVRLR